MKDPMLAVQLDRKCMKAEVFKKAFADRERAPESRTAAIAALSKDEETIGRRVDP